MSNKEYKASCALCGLVVEIDGFSLLSSEGEKKFCCAGCQSVYQLINPTTDKHVTKNIEDNNEDNTP